MSLANFSLVNAPFWAVHPVYSENVWVRNLRVNTSWDRPNTDGVVALKTGRDADGWRVGDKTGTCGTAYNDIGIVWPPEGDAFVLAVYIDRPEAEAEAVNAAIADIARLAVAMRELSALSP